MVTGEVFKTSLVLGLGIITIRDIIAKYGIIPKSWKYSWLFYNDTYNDEIVGNVLKRFGLATKDLNFVGSYIKREKIDDKDFPMLLRLITLLSKYITKYENDLKYGKHTVIHSKFYIDTMGAAHNNDDLIEMCRILSFLIVYTRKKKNKAYPDFVITPKIGNPILARKFAECYNIVSVIKKSNNDHSKATFPDDEYLNRLLVNYEGSQQIIDKSGKSDTKLDGIIIDCNASGASEIRNTMLEFNDIINKTALNISTIDEAYILFRPDTEEDVDGKFESEGAKLYRYFDLNENYKNSIYTLKSDKGVDYERLIMLIIGLNNDKLIKSGINYEEIQQLIAKSKRYP